MTKVLEILGIVYLAIPIVITVLSALLGLFFVWISLRLSK